MLPINNINFKNQSGQALLLVLLSMAVVLTVVLSVTSKSISDVSVATYEEDALRAFSAAEAGIERALLTNQGFVNQRVNPSDGSVVFTSEIFNDSIGSTFVYPQPLKSGESATFWFVNRDPVTGAFSDSDAFTGTKINNLCWGSYANNSYVSGSSGNKPALLVSLFYDETLSYLAGNFNNVKVSRLGYDPEDVRNDSNNFLDDDTTGTSCNINGTDFTYKRKNIFFASGGGASCQQDRFCVPTSCQTTPGCLIMARVKLLYTDPIRAESIGIDVQGGGTNLPAQGNKIESVGTAGNSTRKINVFQLFGEPLNIFDAAVFSKTLFSH